jgi:calpain
MTGHAYGILKVFEVKDPKMKKPRKTHRLLMIRNPWGQLEWKGKWSDHSEEVTTHADLIASWVKENLPANDQFSPGDDDGTFLINYASWRDIYNNMYVCLDFPEKWNGIRYLSEWDKSCAGGIPSPMTEENKLSWATNP